MVNNRALLKRLDAIIAVGVGTPLTGFRRVSLSTLEALRTILHKASQPPPAPKPSGPPRAWVYDIATAVDYSFPADHPKFYHCWETRLSWTRPNVPPNSIRNLKPLYSLDMLNV